MEEIVEIRWLTGCQDLIGKCSDFELYSVVNRKPVEVTKSVTWRKMAKRITGKINFVDSILA